MTLNGYHCTTDNFVKFLTRLTKEKSLSWKELEQEDYSGYYTKLDIKDKQYKIFIFQIGFEQYCIQIQYHFTEHTKRMGPTFLAEYESIRLLLKHINSDTIDFPMTDLKEAENYLNTLQMKYYSDK